MSFCGSFRTISEVSEARLKEDKGEEGDGRRQGAPSARCPPFQVGTFWATSRPGPTLGMTNLPFSPPVHGYTLGLPCTMWRSWQLGWEGHESIWKLCGMQSIFISNYTLRQFRTDHPGLFVACLNYYIK